MNYEKLIGIVNDSAEHYKELLAFENNKLTLIINDDVEEINKLLSKEQALIMRGNSLEVKRINFLKDEGIPDAKLQDLVTQAPNEYKKSLQSGYDNLQKYVLEVKRINNHSLDIVSDKLSAINEINGQADTYDGSGGKKHTTSSAATLEKSI